MNCGGLLDDLVGEREQFGGRRSPPRFRTLQGFEQRLATSVQAKEGQMIAGDLGRHRCRYPSCWDRLSASDAHSYVVWRSKKRQTRCRMEYPLGKPSEKLTQLSVIDSCGDDRRVPHQKRVQNVRIRILGELGQEGRVRCHFIEHHVERLHPANEVAEEADGPSHLGKTVESNRKGGVGPILDRRPGRAAVRCAQRDQMLNYFISTLALNEPSLRAAAVSLMPVLMFS
jgi:hypothetical protein